MPAELRSDRDSPSGDWAFTLAAAAIALLPRLFVAIAWAREPVWDGHYYHAAPNASLWGSATPKT